MDDQALLVKATPTRFTPPPIGCLGMGLPRLRWANRWPGIYAFKVNAEIVGIEFVTCRAMDSKHANPVHVHVSDQHAWIK